MSLPAPNIPVLTIPGLDNSGPAHWQSLWEHQWDACERVDLGQWHAPDRDLWVSRISETLAEISGPVVIAAHSLGCHAFTHWFEQASFLDRGKIGGALLVAPPDLSKLSSVSRVTGFHRSASFTSQVPIIVVGSDNDPYAQTAHVWRLSRQWDAQFVNAGPFGHINAESDIGDWPYGQYLLASLQTSTNAMLERDHISPSTTKWPHREPRFGYQESIQRP